MSTGRICAGRQRKEQFGALEVKAEIFQGESRICISAGDLIEKVKRLAGEQLVETEQIKS